MDHFSGGRPGDYGRWLWFLQDRDPAALLRPVASRMRREDVEAYIELLAISNVWTTIVGRIGGLRLAVGLMDPDCDLEWLHKIENRMNQRARPQSKMDRYVPADELHLFGLRLMDEALEEFAAAEADLAAGVVTFPPRKNPRIRHLKAAVKYRDGMVIGILTQAPLRKGNIASVDLSMRLQRIGSSWSIIIPPGEAKGRAELDYPLSEKLSARVDLYLQTFRREFPGALKSNGFLLSAWGSRAIAPNDLYEAIFERTKREFGAGINLHFFRTITATFIAIEAPGKVNVVRDLLAHKSLATGHEHYILAQGIKASRVMSAIWGEIEEEGG